MVIARNVFSPAPDPEQPAKILKIAPFHKLHRIIIGQQHL